MPKMTFIMQDGRPNEVEAPNGLSVMEIAQRQEAKSNPPLGDYLAKKIDSLESRNIPVGVLDITFYRDDLSTVDFKPVVNTTEIPFEVTGLDIILMDDVLYTGRTIRAALDALFERGRPARVRLLVLIDRGHRELPIEAAFIGRNVQTTDIEIIEVKLQEIDGMEKVLLVERAAASEA